MMSEPYIEDFIVPTSRPYGELHVQTLEATDDEMHEIIYGLVDGYGIRHKMRWIDSKEDWCYSLRYNAFLLIPLDSAVEILCENTDFFNFDPDQWFRDEDDLFVTESDLINLYFLNGDGRRAYTLMQLFSNSRENNIPEKGADDKAPRTSHENQPENNLRNVGTSKAIEAKNRPYQEDPWL